MLQMLYLRGKKLRLIEREAEWGSELFEYFGEQKDFASTRNQNTRLFIIVVCTLTFLKVSYLLYFSHCVSPLTLYSAPPSIFGRFNLHDIAMIPLTALSIPLKEPEQ
jgi:hypothetical protein